MEIGYRKYEKNITDNPNLPEERKKAWKEFENVREALYNKYLEVVKNDSRFSNSSLESAIREVNCGEENRDINSVVKQWKDVVERYMKEDKNNLKDSLFEILNKSLEKKSEI